MTTSNAPKNAATFLFSNPIMPNSGPIIDPEKCIHCNTCVNVCRSDVFVPGAEEGQTPRVVYPDECWFCGNCVTDCPTGACLIEHPLNQRIGWKRKKTGEYFRIGMQNPPPPNTRPPYGPPDTRPRPK